MFSISSDLLQNKGVVIDPEIDDNLVDPEEGGVRQYFGMDGMTEEARAKVDHLLNMWPRPEESDSGAENDDSEDAEDFEKKAKKFVNILPDGGVKKKVIVNKLKNTDTDLPHSLCCYSLFPIFDFCLSCSSLSLLKLLSHFVF